MTDAITPGGTPGGTPQPDPALEQDVTAAVNDITGDGGPVDPGTPGAGNPSPVPGS